MESQTPRLSIVFVNYFCVDLIINAINSINKNIIYNEFEYIVVDNSSDITGKQKVISQFGNLVWIDMKYNAGFARANNAGIDMAKNNVILLLNTDTIAIDNSIANCYSRFVNSQYVGVGIQLLDIDHKLQISGSFFVRGGLNHLLPIPYYGEFIRWLGYNTKQKPPSIQQPTSVQDVDWISGAFMMVKREAVAKAGLMDEDFFLYAEEVEWCNRLKKVGPLCIFGDLNIIHLEGSTINKDQNLEERGYYNLYDKKGLQLMVSNHVRVRKQYGVGWFLFLLLNYTFGILVFAVAGTLHDVFTLSNPIKQWNRLGAYTKNVITLWGLTPTIIRNKPHFYKMF